MDERKLINHLREQLPKSPDFLNWLDDDCEIVDFGQVVKTPGIHIKVNGQLVELSVKGFIHQFEGYKLFP